MVWVTLRSAHTSCEYNPQWTKLNAWPFMGAGPQFHTPAQPLRTHQHLGSGTHTQEAAATHVGRALPHCPCLSPQRTALVRSTWEQLRVWSAPSPGRPGRTAYTEHLTVWKRLYEHCSHCCLSLPSRHEICLLTLKHRLQWRRTSPQSQITFLVNHGYRNLYEEKHYSTEQVP